LASHNFVLMGFLSRTYEAISDWVKGLVYRIIGRSEEWELKREIIREKRKYTDLLVNSEIQYEPEEPDKLLALQATAYLKERFPDGILPTLIGTSVDERMLMYQEMVEEIRCLFEVDKIKFEIKYPETEEEFKSMTLGFYNHEENLLCLNGAFIECDNPMLWEEMVFALFHEMKHARQYSAVDKTYDYGYSDELLKIWKYNMVVYIEPSECDEAYRKQAIERDAFGLVDMIRENFEN